MQCLLETLLQHWRVFGVDAVIVLLQLVHQLHDQLQLFPSGSLAQQGEPEYVVELRKSDDFTILDSRACILADMMLLENTYRDTFHIGADKGLKELQCQRC
jgi:hypothetical protein